MVEEGNVLHHVKRRGKCPRGEMLGRICPGGGHVQGRSGLAYRALGLYLLIF